MLYVGTLLQFCYVLSGGRKRRRGISPVPWPVSLERKVHTADFGAPIQANPSGRTVRTGGCCCASSKWHDPPICCGYRTPFPSASNVYHWCRWRQSPTSLPHCPSTCYKWLPGNGKIPISPMIYLEGIFFIIVDSFVSGSVYLQLKSSEFQISSQSSYISAPGPAGCSGGVCQWSKFVLSNQTPSNSHSCGKCDSGREKQNGA